MFIDDGGRVEQMVYSRFVKVFMKTSILFKHTNDILSEKGGVELTKGSVGLLLNHHQGEGLNLLFGDRIPRAENRSKGRTEDPVGGL
jgi:hypothetical protein